MSDVLPTLSRDLRPIKGQGEGVRQANVAGPNKVISGNEGSAHEHLQGGRLWGDAECTVWLRVINSTGNIISLCEIRPLRTFNFGKSAINVL